VTEVVELEARGQLVPYRPSLFESLRECWHYRGVLRQMASQLSLFTYRQTLLGFWWIPIVVIFDTVGRAVIFGRILNVPSAYGIPYLIFLSVGTMAWWLFNRTLLFTLRSFVRFRRVTKDLYVPLALIPIASMWQTALEFGFYGPVLLGYFGVFWGLDGGRYLNGGPGRVFSPTGYV